MKLYRPKSFLILLLASFILVALPLLAALVSSVYFMEKMAVKSTEAVFRSADSAKESRFLLEALITQERQARLYDVLGDPDNLREVQTKHIQIQEILAHFNTFPFSGSEKTRIEQFRSLENEIFDILNHGKATEDRKTALAKYKELNALGQLIQTASNNLMMQEAEDLQNVASRFQKMMFWLTFILFFVSLILISIFAYLLIRPIRQIDKSILRLGEGDFVTPVTVSGPKDLEFLGTKLDWMRERLAELEKEKNKFVAHISHELKTPLASIREGAGLLGEELVGPLTEQQKAVVKILNNNSRILQKLIENIVNFNMAQARYFPAKKEPFSLDKLIAEVCADHNPLLLANSVTLHQKLLPVIINGDRDQIRIVIDNLLSNAIKHSPFDTDIYISLKHDNNHTIVDIIDSGPGIAEQDRSKIFKPFFQGKAMQKGKVKGTGLGLAIAKEYMTNHKGLIELIPAPKAGAHFRLTFPIGGTA